METIDYKEKYMQAMERARQFFEKPYLEDSAWIVGYIFPELKESKDDRIRKRLTEYFEGYYDRFATDRNHVNVHWEGLEVKEVLAWLEKQGGHANFLNKIQIGDKVTRNEDGVLVNLSQLKRVTKKDEKQGKTSPILSNSSKNF